MFSKLEDALKEQEKVSQYWSVISDRTDEQEFVEDQEDGSNRDFIEYRRTVIFATTFNHMRILQSTFYKEEEELTETVISRDAVGEIVNYFNQLPGFELRM
jgi:hypothetical protein